MKVIVEVSDTGFYVDPYADPQTFTKELVANITLDGVSADRLAARRAPLETIIRILKGAPA